MNWFIDLIECTGNGIIDLLDEECKIPRGSNEQFTASVHKKFTGHFRIQLPRQSRLSQHKSLRDEEGFIIRHFAGAVCYKTVSLFISVKSHYCMKSIFRLDSLRRTMMHYTAA